MSNLKNWQGVATVIGVDFGDSGKGRLVDDLAQRAHIVARYNGGSNTGHTVKNRFGNFALHIIPSGIFNQKANCLIGRGVALDLESLIEDEIVQLKNAGLSWKNLMIDEQATLTMPWHKAKDGLREKHRQTKLGTTGKGVGPTYADRVERVGMRLKDLYSNNFKTILKEEINFQNKFFNLRLNFLKIYEQYSKYPKIIKPHVGQTTQIVKDAQKKGKNILFEGAQGWLLDIDNGTYPFVTSSNPGILGIWRSFDIYPQEIDYVIGITKAYMTRVGKGPMPTTMTNPQKDIVIRKGQEIGTTSGRVRVPGWLDLVAVKAACQSNKVTHLALTKIDIFSGFKTLKICIDYKVDGRQEHYTPGDAQTFFKVKPVYEELPGWQEEISSIRTFKGLPTNAQSLISKIENFLEVPISIIGVGPERNQVIYV